MKNITYDFKQLTCLFTLLFTGIISVVGTCSLNAATITAFPPSSFYVTDHTLPRYTRDNHPYNLVGYRYIPEKQSPKEAAHYQLTDTVPYMTVAMWNKKDQIDLNHDWEIEFKLYFGQGITSHPVHYGCKADGIAFVLHAFDTMATKSGLIGQTDWHLGYGHTSNADPFPNLSSSQDPDKNNNTFQETGDIMPSFAVEFDTEYGDGNQAHPYFDEGAPANVNKEHVVYLKNGNMTALPDTYKPMQNNGSVCINDWLDVKIVWKRYSTGLYTYYDLLTYISEGHDGPLRLRNSMRFYSLSEVIEGLEVDENCQALVNWGVTSATCWDPNKHKIEFVKLTTTDPPIPNIVATIQYNCFNVGPCYTPLPVSPTSSTGSTEPSYQDTIFPNIQHANIANCNGINGWPAKDTMEYTIPCSNGRCSYSIRFENIPGGTEQKYYLNNMLMDSVTHHPLMPHWIIPLNREYFVNDSIIHIKALINNIEYNFKILYRSNTTDWAKQLAQDL